MNYMILSLIGFVATLVWTLAGGGGLISMPSMLLFGVPIHSAIAAAKFSNIFSSFSSFFYLFKNKQIKLKSALITIPFGLAGGVTGGIIANSLSERTMTTIAVGLLTFALCFTFIRKPSEKNNEPEEISKDLLPYLYSISVYDGMFGPGQASLLMYTYLHKGFSYLKAMAFTRFQTFISCFGSFFSYVFAGSFDIKVAIFLAIGSLLGAQTAVRIAGRLSPVVLKRVLHFVTIILILQLGYRLIH